MDLDSLDAEMAAIHTEEQVGAAAAAAPQSRIVLQDWAECEDCLKWRRVKQQVTDEDVYTCSHFKTKFKTYAKCSAPLEKGAEVAKERELYVAEEENMDI